jgi:F-type H+-transporting ATPase subunit delta
MLGEPFAFCAAGGTPTRPGHDDGDAAAAGEADAAGKDCCKLASEATGLTLLAERYAAALFAIADERRALDEAAGDLRRLRAMLGESPDLVRLIRSAVLPRRVQAQAVAAVAETAEFSSLVRDFLAVVARNRRLFAVPAMIETYLARLAARRGEVTVEVAAAQPLSEAQLAALGEALRQSAGQRVAVDVRVDAGLLGGIVVKLGSRLVDASLKGRLDRLRSAMIGAA